MRKFGLIGFPLGQSFSNKYFTKKFLSENLNDCLHQAYPIKSINELKDILKDPELEGLNVTIPYKKAVIPYLHKLDEVVQVIQACNCIKIQEGNLTGYNTDVTGFEQSLLPLLDDHHVKALILGTGGASAAVEYVLQKLKIDYLFVSRTSGRNKNIISYEVVDNDLLETHHLIINTTPLGMFPDMDGFPDIPYTSLSEKHLLYDLIYNPGKTTFLQKGEHYGARIKNGAEMLIIQAEESWKIWNH